MIFRYIMCPLLQSFFSIRVLLKIFFGREVIAAFLLTVAASHVFGKSDYVFRIDVSGKTSVVVALRAGVPGNNSFVWF